VRFGFFCFFLYLLSEGASQKALPRTQPYQVSSSAPRITRTQDRARHAAKHSLALAPQRSGSNSQGELSKSFKAKK